MKQFPLPFQILLALLLGVLTGIFLPGITPYIGWMGDGFLRALKMIIIPLILASIISGVANIGSAENLGRLGIKTILYYLITSVLAITTGLILVNLIQPGVGVDLEFAQTIKGLSSANKSFGEILLEMIPVNIFQAFMEGNMLAIILFSILFGFFITRTKEATRKSMTHFFDAFFEVMMKLTGFIIRLAPFGVFAIVAQQLSQTENILSLVTSMGSYMITVLIGLGIHMFISLPVIMLVAGHSNPVYHFRASSVPLLTAFSTSSSSATLPLTIDSVEHHSGVSNKISSFTLPLGATVNMNGTALYECVAVMFIAQAYGIELSLMQQAIVMATALFAAIGSAGIPMAGLVMMSIVLTAVGLPLEGIGLILAVDRILDMFRTTVNVWGDICGAIIIARSEGEKLKA